MSKSHLILSLFLLGVGSIEPDALALAADGPSSDATTTVVFKAERPGGARPFLLVPVFHAFFFAEPRLSTNQMNELGRSTVTFREIDDSDSVEVARNTADFRSLPSQPAFGQAVASELHDRLFQLEYFRQDGRRLENLLAAHPYFLTEKVGEMCASGVASPGNESFILGFLRTTTRIRSLDDGPVLVQQIRDVPLDDWVKQLKYNLSQAENLAACRQRTQTFYEATTRAYLRWDIDSVRNIFNDDYLSPGMPRASAGIIASPTRNLNFIAQMEATADVPGRVFLIGAVHFGGPDGLVSALKMKSYRISEVH